MLAFQPFLKQVTSAVSESRKNQCIRRVGDGTNASWYIRDNALKMVQDKSPPLCSKTCLQNDGDMYKATLESKVSISSAYGTEWVPGTQWALISDGLTG